jgi:hypothetical protein
LTRKRAFSMSCLSLLLCVAASAAEPPDHHLAGDPARRLFRASPFAHGYIHGYEHGFGLGDEDVQNGRGAREIRKTGEYRDADGGYRREFGARESFRAGFREGLSIGYRDAIAGGEFRALAALRRLATGLDDLLTNSADRLYDGGFFAGYRAARQESAGDCQGPAPAARERYCSGFLAGYELGESDSGAATTARDRNAPPPVLLPRPGGRNDPRP